MAYQRKDTRQTNACPIRDRRPTRPFDARTNANPTRLGAKVPAVIPTSVSRGPDIPFVCRTRSGIQKIQARANIARRADPSCPGDKDTEGPEEGDGMRTR